MKHPTTVIALLVILVSACTNRQAGLNEYHEALKLMEQGDAPSALEHLERAGELAQTDSLRALVNSQMGTLYFQQRLLDRSLQSYRRAYDIDLRARDTLGLIYDLRDIGNVLRATEESADSCLEYFERARQLAKASGNLAMQRDVESQMAAHHLYRNHLDEARRLLMPALEYVDEDNRSGLYFMMADYYARAQQRDSATYYYRILLQEGNIYARQAAHHALARYAIDDGNNEQALLHLKQYELLTDSLHEANDAAAIRQTAALYDYTLHQRQADRYQRQAIIAGATVVLLILLFVSLFLYASRRRMNYQLKVQQLEHLLSEHARQPKTADDDTAASPLMTRLKQLIDDPRQPALPEEEWAEVEKTVDEQCPDFLRRISRFCRLNPQERRVCLLLRLSMSPAAIAQLTAHTRQAVTNTRSRLYQKAFGKKGSPAQWDEFILSL